jgi:hypothetical protein
MASVNKKFAVEKGLEVGQQALFVDADTNKTGVGKTNAKYALDVAGTANFDGVVTAGAIGVGSTQPVRGADFVSDIQIYNKLYDSKNSSGTNGQVLKSVGTAVSWTDLAEIQVNAAGTDYQVQYRKTDGKFGGANQLYYNPTSDRVGIGTSVPEYLFQVKRPRDASSNGYVQIGGTFLDAAGTVGAGASILSANSSGELRWVSIASSEFNVIFVTQDGNDSNDGRSVTSAKRTIKAACGIAQAGNVIRVTAGSYVENNPIVIPRNITIDGDDLRHTQVIPTNIGRDLFYVDNGNLLQNMSFVGAANTGSMIAFSPPRENIHTNVSIASSAVRVNSWVGTALTPTAVTYHAPTGITTLTFASPHGLVVGVDTIGISTGSLGFTCKSDNDNTVYLHPRANDPLAGIFTAITATTPNTFTINVGNAGIGTQYVGLITQSPYIRNCTNFVANSIGMKIDGKHSAGSKSMVCDSYTQYNQGGIGVSISNDGYAQLVSIFTICDDIAISCYSGGSCDLNNSNASFGNYGLIASGVGTVHYTGTLAQTAIAEDNQITISGIGSQRPYTGQVLYIGELFNEVISVTMTSTGAGYTESNPPIVTIDFPDGPGGARAEGVANVSGFGSVTSISLIANGRQYRSTPIVTIGAPNIGIQTATAVANLGPAYYTINSATTPTAGVSTITLDQTLPANVGVGSTIPFAKQSLILASSYTFEYIGSGTTIATAFPLNGGVSIPENMTRSLKGGKVVYTSTDEKGNFRIGDGFTINQQTGTITGDAFNKSIQAILTPLIITLGG